MASKPVQAATSLGCILMSKGSTIAIVQFTFGALTSTFVLVFVLVIAAHEVTSAPVPDVVATAICGTVHGLSFLRVSMKGGSKAAQLNQLLVGVGRQHADGFAGIDRAAASDGDYPVTLRLREGLVCLHHLEVLGIGGNLVVHLDCNTVVVEAALDLVDDAGPLQARGDDQGLPDPGILALIPNGLIGAPPKSNPRYGIRVNNRKLSDILVDHTFPLQVSVELTKVHDRWDQELCQRIAVPVQSGTLPLRSIRGNLPHVLSCCARRSESIS